MSVKIVINKCYGGFSLSDEAVNDLGLDDSRNYSEGDEWRSERSMIHLIETKGSAYCSGQFAKLKIVEIPDDIEWQIEEYDGIEWVSEVHRTWG